MTHRIRPPSANRLFRFVVRSPNDIRGDVEDEFAFHIDMRVEDLVKLGLSHSDARAQALREFGRYSDGTQACAREDTTMERQRTLSRLVSEFRHDVTFGARLLSRSPGFSIVAVLTLALSIGGNTAIFSVVNALALKPLPARTPEEIVRIYTAESQTSWPNYQDIAARSEVFSEVAAHTGATRALATADNTSRISGEMTSANYLAMFGVPAQLGRVYLPSDARTDIVVLGERSWRTRFGSDPSIVGRIVMLSGRPFEVLGVMPRGFRGARPAGFFSDFWIPIDLPKMGSMMHDRGKVAFQIAARLKPGVNAAQAQAATQIVALQLAREYPELRERFGQTEVFRIDGVAGFRGVTRTLAPLFAFIGLLTIIAGIVLLVGCANIAGLLLGRGAARRREIGVRLALGAGRSRLVRQLLTESLLLAVLGGALGTVLAIWLTGSMSSFATRMSAPIELDLSLDPRVLFYTLALSLLTSLLCGLAPARRATRMAVVPALKDDNPPPERQRLRHWLVVGQVGLSCALLLWGGLFLRSLSNAQNVDIGMDPNGVLIARLEFEEESARSGSIAPFLRGLHERIEVMPGVETQGLAKVVPLTFSGREEMRMRTESDPLDQPGRWVLVNRIGPGWFQTVRIPILVGRDFTFDDRAGAPRVAVVNETAARQFWNGDALGKRIHDADVIGVVADSKYLEPRRGDPAHGLHRVLSAARAGDHNLPTHLEPGRRHQGAPHRYRAAGSDALCRHQADDRRAESIARARTGRRRGDERLWRARRNPRDDGHLRSRRVYRRSTHARDRHPQGRRRRHTRDRHAHRFWHRASGGHRTHRRPRARNSWRPRAQRLCRRRFCRRPADAGWNDGARGGNDPRSKRAPGAAGREDRSVGGVES